MRHIPLAFMFVVVAVIVGGMATASAESATRVSLNGVWTPVQFNDGDSFRVMSGPYAETRARLAGFNTLESHGPVHRWGTWTATELYTNAKLATTNAREGEWHCESGGERDVYGRILWWCPDLAADQIRRGLAHALTIDEKPAPELLLAAQRKAIAERRGMWAKGVPALIVTSTHSASEGGGRNGKTYNRLVSSEFGHSERWQHTTRYNECEEVCAYERRYDAAVLAAVIESVRADPSVKGVIDRLDEAHAAAADAADAPPPARAVDDLGAQRVRADAALVRLIEKNRSFGTVGFFNQDDKAVDALDAAIERAFPRNVKPTSETLLSCMVHVDFRRRYGSGRAACLRK